MFSEGEKIICCFVGGFLARMKIFGDFAVLLIFCCYVGIFCCFGAVNFVGLICCFVVTGLEDVSGRGKNNLLFCWWFFGQNENFRRFCCYVGIFCCFGAVLLD